LARRRKQIPLREALIDSLNHDGSGVARVDGKVATTAEIKCAAVEMNK